MFAIMGEIILWVAPACILILAVTSYKAVIKHGEDEL